MMFIEQPVHFIQATPSKGCDATSRILWNILLENALYVTMVSRKRKLSYTMNFERDKSNV